MTIETQTNPQGPAEAAPPNPAEAAPQVPDGSQGPTGDEFAGLLEHPELEQTAPPTGSEDGNPASGEPQGQAGEGEAAPGQGQEPTPEAGAFAPITITYNGKPYTIDSADKATELIQKGLDYRVKMQRLGQHRGTLELVNQALRDPQRAEQVKALLTGQGAGQGQSAAKPQDGQQILVPVEGPDGKTVYMQPDQGAVSLVTQLLQQALEPYRSVLEGAGKQPTQDGDPYVSVLVQQAKETELSNFIDANYPQSATWGQSREKVIEAMAADGIGPGHPANDDPNAWLSYYMRLAVAGKLPARQGGELVTTPKVVDKSALKAGAQTPKPSAGKPPQIKTQELVGRALAPGAGDQDFDAALELFIDHPGIK